ncbi:MAG: asparagine synthase-related protein [Methylococcales bacterium]
MLRLSSELLPQPLHALGRRLVGRNVLKPWLKVDELQLAGVRLEPYGVTSGGPDGRGRRLAELERSLLTDGGLAHLLRHGDRNSMRWSVESRVPFLTTELAELALSLPEHYLVSDEGETKSVFRAAMRGIVPDAVLDRRDKVGFETPELRWLNSDQLDLDEILEPAAELKFFDMDQLKREVREVLSGEVPFSWQAWRIINYCKWASLVLLR